MWRHTDPVAGEPPLPLLPLADDPQFSREIALNEHTWKQKRDGTGWRRLTKKGCYTNDQLLVGARGKAERVSAMATLEEIARFRRNELARQPPGLRTDQAKLDWADYSFYAERRLEMIVENLAAGLAPPPPPRTFESFRNAFPPGHVVRLNI
jgi:hypothetical protein